METRTCSQIGGDLIPEGSRVVFDWDNTLKVYNKETRTITSRVAKKDLKNWKENRKCELFVISAIHPTRLNLETLLIEVEKLGLTDIFIKETDSAEIYPGKYARKGNVIICGYDKAEVFLDICSRLETSEVRNDNVETDPGQYGTGEDEPDAVHDGLDESVRIDGVDQKRTVLFFDDEEVNISNFSAIVEGSICYLVK
ncbi:uncharacterized protein LOC127845832 [Dreissena polymorpha]|uniref:Uncharacterized protein n=1 Tax=Dreissena polymorpha TaxID=45954 RepID=A0A9D4IN15_DREPO|nr:uncharacterized protein LOC127845832 [Dreissena polymorpha]KAH3778849.1 hypothetical protein DPMN_180323 [Dreissena polymorpha]